MVTVSIINVQDVQIISFRSEFPDMGRKKKDACHVYTELMKYSYYIATIHSAIKVPYSKEVCNVTFKKKGGGGGGGLPVLRIAANTPTAKSSTGFSRNVDSAANYPLIVPAFQRYVHFVAIQKGYPAAFAAVLEWLLIGCFPVCRKAKGMQHNLVRPGTQHLASVLEKINQFYNSTKVWLAASVHVHYG